MQFITNGPDIPERLLQAHEDGRVVFFCGAGISYPARLPGFAGLVKKIYTDLAVLPNPVQQAAIKAGQFDTAIGLLEADYVDGREVVRRKLADILKPDLNAPNAIATHKALMMLGKCRRGQTRLITTNFDRLFEEVIAAQSRPIERFKAPLLPVPKSRWDGLVYLHGLLGTAPTASELDRLVVSSGDFGLAYLTERWAARFISELFRNYILCFVGYSINDPVLRYMMDALAADRLLGESPPEMFAFGSYSKGKEDERANEWRAKNVTPILYREHNRHAYLHKTLRAWADTYRDGALGKEAIIVKHARTRPQESTQQDDFVGRMLWALSDQSGLPAKRFAELDPVPSLDWLVPLSEDRFGHADLGRFGVPSRAEADSKLRFSLIRRPAPYDHAAPMLLASGGITGSQWDDVMFHLARWLTRHLDDPRLVIWIAEHGGQPHDNLTRLLEQRLDELAQLEHEDNRAELTQIRANAPKAIPGPLMRSLWRLLLTGRVKSSLHDFDLYRWRNQFKRDGLTATLRLELREILTPRVSLREPFNWPEDENRKNSEPIRINDLVGWEIVLSTEHVHTDLQELSKNESWTAALPELLSDFSALLCDALDLMRELDGADDRSDRSYIHQPSISEHTQNRYSQDWTALIELTRDAWLATVAKSPERAALVAESWMHTPYPLFRRLAFFATAQGNVIPLRRAVDWLLADGHWWLWSVETQRETVRLLVALAPQLDEGMLGELEQALLTGPPREMFKKDIEPECLTRVVDREIWLRLAKIDDAGAILGRNAKARLDGLSAQHPEWKLAEKQRDEFPFWMESGWVGDRNSWQDFISIPRSRHRILNYLIANPELPTSKQDNWQERCKDSFQATAYALCHLAKRNIWPNDRWQVALQVWSEDELQSRSWRYMAPILTTVPDEVLQTLAHSVSCWLQAIAKNFNGHEELFFGLARRILAQDFQDSVDFNNDPVGQAINHPVGRVTEAMLNWWYRRPLEDGQGLPEELKSVFTELCETTLNKFRHGRVLLAAHVITLYRVDQGWATQHLLPLFDWQRSTDEASAAWNGFLWSPRLYLPLLTALKPHFLASAGHYAELGESRGQFATFLTYAALEQIAGYTVKELRTAMRALSQEGLEECARTLSQALEGSADQRGNYWENRVQPFLKNIWPKSRSLLTPQIAESFARLIIAAGSRFPDALTALKGWLQPIESPHYIVHLLDESELCKRFPERALNFLDTVIVDPTWTLRKLGKCLNDIKQTAPNLTQDVRYMRLRKYY